MDLVWGAKNYRDGVICEIYRNFGIGSRDRRRRSKAVFVEQDFSCFEVSFIYDVLPK
jgi:hypothetical protein